MSRGTNQKFKFTYLMKIMLAKTDDEHALTMPQIMEELEKFDVTAERKSIYDCYRGHRRLNKVRLEFIIGFWPFY